MNFDDFAMLKVGDRIVVEYDDEGGNTPAVGTVVQRRSPTLVIVVWDAYPRQRSISFYHDNVVRSMRLLEKSDGVDVVKTPITVPQPTVAFGDKWSDEVRKRLREREQNSPHWNPYPDGEG